MARILPFTFLVASVLSGCIVYDTEGKKDEHDPFWDSGYTTGSVDEPVPADTGDDTAATEEPAPAYTLSLTPSETLPGNTFIASLTAEGDFDLSAVSSLAFYGTVNIVAVENRGDEILLSIAVPGEAVPGAADLLLTLSDGSAVLMDDALTILSPEVPEDTGNGEETGQDDSGVVCE